MAIPVCSARNIQGCFVVTNGSLEPCNLFVQLPQSDMHRTDVEFEGSGAMVRDYSLHSNNFIFYLSYTVFMTNVKQ